MSLFSWLKKGNNPTSEASSVDTSTQTSSEPSEKEVFKSPVLLAEWVNKYLLEAFPLEDNYEHLPDEESRKELNITYEQRERYIREIPILRISGVSLFIKQYYNDEFWLKFSKAIYPFLYRHLHSDNYTDEQLTLLANAVEKYVSCAEDGDEKETSLHYMRRVYDDSDNFVKLLADGVGYLSVQWLMDAYEIFRDAYCTVTQGMSYESCKTILEAMEKIENEKA
ncbi:MAG: hypothetical protein IPM20_05185 [Gammaproteobacteria bacterium]|nr:hypothetical protein [Gammaproteobacteria bacterium]